MSLVCKRINCTNVRVSALIDSNFRIWYLTVSVFVNCLKFLFLNCLTFLFLLFDYHKMTGENS